MCGRNFDFVNQNLIRGNVAEIFSILFLPAIREIPGHRQSFMYMYKVYEENSLYFLKHHLLIKPAEVIMNISDFWFFFLQSGKFTGQSMIAGNVPTPVNYLRVEI